MNIYLDDIRLPIESAYSYSAANGLAHLSLEERELLYKYKDWEVVRSHDEFVSLIKELSMNESDFLSIRYISFDHDLGEEHYTYTPTLTKEGKDYLNIVKEFQEKTGFSSFIEYIKTFCFFRISKSIDGYLKDDPEFPIILFHTYNGVAHQNMKYYFNAFLELKYSEIISYIDYYNLEMR